MDGRKKHTVQNEPGSVDLCEDLTRQPIAFANYLHNEAMELTAFKLKITPEVLQAIEECKKQKNATLTLRAVDWQNLEETYLTV